jgi:hypothetical protein
MGDLEHGIYVPVPRILNYIYTEMETISHTQRTLGTHHSYIFWLPQRNHHQAVQNHKKEIYLHKSEGEERGYLRRNICFISIWKDNYSSIMLL